MESGVANSLGTAGPFDDERNAAGGIICRAVLAIDAEFPLVFTMVGRDDDGCVLIDAGGFEPLNDDGNLVIRITDSHVIAVDHAPHGGLVGDLAGLAGKLGVYLGIIHPDVERRMGPGHFLMPFNQGLVVKPCQQGFLSEGVPDFGRNTVGGVRIPVVDVEIPVVLADVIREPFLDNWLDSFG